MTTTKTTERAGEAGRMAFGALALTAAALWVGGSGVAGQERPGACAESERVGSLGITGIRCERCSFFTNGRSQAGVFYTEPMIEALNEQVAAAEVLRVGDVLVALENELITTTAGSELFSSLPPSGRVRVAVRRSGRLTHLDVPLSPTCPVPADALEKAPERTVVVGARPVSRADGRTLRVDTLVAGAALGFDVTCVECRRDEESGAWIFDEPPQVGSVPTGSLAYEEWHMPSGVFLRALDGVPLTTAEGGRRFAAIEAGDHLRWTVFQYGREREIETVALHRADDSAARQAARTGDPVSDAMRLVFSGDAGPAHVEVRYADGVRAGLRVEPGRDDGEIVIWMGDKEVRVRVDPAAPPPR